MLKKVPVDQLWLGMHLQELCGASVDHPFWKTKIVLTDAVDLARAAQVAPPAIVPFDEEVRRAAAVCTRSREAVVSLFNEARMGKAIDTEKCAEMVAEISESVWRNPSALVSLARLRTHPERGHELLLTGRGVDAMVLDVCSQHHEKMDGSGYPHRLQGEQISLLARMAAWSKGNFGENVFRSFVTSLGIYPVGSMVRLRSGYLAVVTQQNPVKLTAPEVKVFFSTKQGLRTTPRVLDLADPKCSDRIVGRESNEQWQFAHLDELWAGEEALQMLGCKG